MPYSLTELPLIELARRVLTAEESFLYILHVYGDGFHAPMTFYALGKKVNKPAQTVERVVTKAALKVIREQSRENVTVTVSIAYTPASGNKPRYKRAIAEGHDVRDVTDTTQKGAITKR